MKLYAISCYNKNDLLAYRFEGKSNESFKDDGKSINMKVERRMYVKFLIMVKLDSSQGIRRCRLLNDSFKSFRSILDLE